MLTFGYWFNLRPLSMPKTWIIGLDIFFGLFILLGIVAAVSGRKSDKFLAKRLFKISKLGWVTGLVGFLWLFFSYEGAVIVGVRFWFLFIIIVDLIWVGFILNDIKKNLAKERALQGEKERFEKYLPKRRS